MAKHFTKSKFTQDLPVAHTAHVKLPLPMLSALEDIDRAFFGICVEAGKQVLGAMMEHDRTALCGLPWKPDEERPGRRAGSTESPVTLGGRRIADSSTSRSVDRGRRTCTAELRGCDGSGSTGSPHARSGGSGRIDSTLCAKLGSTAAHGDRTVDLEERCLPSVRGVDRAETGRVDQPRGRGSRNGF